MGNQITISELILHVKFPFLPCSGGPNLSKFKVNIQLNELSRTKKHKYIHNWNISIHEMKCYAWETKPLVRHKGPF